MFLEQGVISDETRKTRINSARGKASPDVVAFCILMARIMMRCLRQHDSRLEKFLFLPDPSIDQQAEVPHDPTAA
jgi:hypothetical protein